MRARLSCLKCPACLQNSSTSKLLPCLHSICQNCVEKCLKHSKVSEEKCYQFQCPICVKIVTKPPNELLEKQWAWHFPVNAILLSSLQDTKTKVIQTCDPCMYVGESNTATSYCTTCKEILCPACDGVHRKSRATRQHTFLRLDENVEPAVAVTLAVSMTCTYHWNKDVEFYCVPHNSMCCSECLDCHRGCNETLKLKEHADKLLKADELSKLTERMKALEDHLEKFTAVNDETQRELETSTEEMTTEIDKLIAILNEAKSRMSSEREGLLEDESRTRRSENQQCESLKATFRDFHHLLGAVVKYGDRHQSLVILHKVKESLAYCEKTIQDNNLSVRQVGAKLLLNEHLISLRKLTGSQIAKIEVTENKLKLDPCVHQNCSLRSDTILTTTAEVVPSTTTTSKDLVVQRVLEKQKTEPFYLEKTELSVEEYVPPPLDPCRLFLKNLSAGITEEFLSLYLEPRCGATPTKILFGRLPGTALVTFSEPPDIGLLLRKVKEKTLQGQYIQVIRVPVTCSVKLRGLLPSTTRDTVVLYFENAKRTNGGPVKELKEGREKQSFIITFENAGDAERVCRRQHTIDKKEIQVCLYYECLDDDLDADDFSDLTHGTEDTVGELKLPDPVKLNNWNPQILRFLMNNRKHRAMFEKNLSDVNGVAKWPSSVEGYVIIECTMKVDDKQANSLLKDWTTRVISKVNSFVAGLEVAEFNLIQMAWPRVLEVLQTITIDNPEDVGVFVDKEKYNIAVAGPRANVQELKNVIKQMIITVEAKINLEMKRVRETKKLKTFEIALLRMSHFNQDIEKMHPELQFEIDWKERMAIFDGQADIVQKVMIQMHEKLNSFVSRSMQISKPARNLLFTKETRKYIKQKMFSQKIVGVWDVMHEEVLMFGRGEKEVRQAIQLVMACLVENRIPLDEAMAQLVQGQQWSQLIQGILKKHPGKCAVESDIKGIKVVAVDDIFQDVFNEVKAFLDYHTVQETFLELDPERVIFIKQYRNYNIMELEKRYEKSLVKLSIADIGKQKGVKIKGTKDGCKLAKVAVAEMAKSVFTIEHVMANKVGLKELLQGSRGRGQLGSIEVRWKCFIAMKNANKPDTWQSKGATGNNTSGSEDDEDQSPMSMDWQRSPENGSAVVYFGKIRVSVIKGELAKQKVDVIVNSTSPKLDLRIGAISKTILFYGGDSIQKECLQQYPNGINPGQVVVTNGGNLRCTKVYHGCLSTYDIQGSSVKLMETFVYSCLSTADQRNVQSMAFPALGTGYLGFPPDLVGKLMLTCIKSYSDTKRKTSLKDILLVVYPSDINTIQAFMAVVGETTVQSASSNKNASPSSNITIVPGKCRCTFPGSVYMDIVQGDITKEATDAIVNSVPSNLDLTQGQVSKAILTAGGISIQQECLLKVGDLKANGFAITKAGRLPCKIIIHRVAQDKREDWEDMIKQVLCQADKLVCQSISFPALGTGGKGLSPEKIAQAMYSACAEFAKSQPNSLKQIRVVLFQDTMLTTFVQAIKVHSSGQSESKTVGRIPRTREKMSSLVLSITTDSKSNAQSAIRDIESFVKSEIMEKEINSPREIISKLLDRQITKIELMGQGKAMVSVNQRKSIILVSGAPKEVLDTYDKVMKYLRNIEIDKLKEAQEKLKKQQEMSDVGLPATWTPMANDENLKCVSLNPKDQEYIRVSQKFLASAGGAGQQAAMMAYAMNYVSPGLTVIQIERVQNKSLYQQYKAKKRQLEQQNNGQANEKELWHGTASTSILNINHNGFNRSYSGSGSHGNGTYFAVNASYSVSGYCRADASGLRHIYLAHVMTGDSIVLGSGTRVLPPKDPKNPHITYDSTTDNLANPQMFVIFHDTQAYPSYHITFC